MTASYSRAKFCLKLSESSTDLNEGRKQSPFVCFVDKPYHVLLLQKK